jgi:hypothetical protein
MDRTPCSWPFRAPTSPLSFLTSPCVAGRRLSILADGKEGGMEPNPQKSHKHDFLSILFLVYVARMN